MMSDYLGDQMSNESQQDGKPDEGNASAEEHASGRGAIVALVAIVLIAVVGWLLFRELSASSRLQDCLLSGRTNCAPIETPTR
jgi:hypothetical protein